eukprot:11450502-Alexandrium_andersonii.AAC.1
MRFLRQRCGRRDGCRAELALSARAVGAMRQLARRAMFAQRRAVRPTIGVRLQRATSLVLQGAGRSTARATPARAYAWQGVLVRRLHSWGGRTKHSQCARRGHACKCHTRARAASQL